MSDLELRYAPRSCGYFCCGDCLLRPKNPLTNDLHSCNSDLCPLKDKENKDGEI